MIITAVRIRKLENTGTKLIGVCSITLDNMIVIHDIKILNNDGMFLAMPSKRTTAGSFKDVVHPINSEARGKIEEIIFGLYETAIEYEGATQTFKCINLDCGSMMEQICADFIPDEN